MNYREKLTEMFINWSGEKVESIFSLPPTASNRRYIRFISESKQAIGAFNPDLKENKAFLYISKHLKNKGINVPEVFDENLTDHIYLIEDIGDETLFDYVWKIRQENNSDQKILSVYKRVINCMPDIQIKAAQDMNFNICYPRSAFDYQSIMWDLHYFKNYFLKFADVKFYEQDIEDDFNAFTNFLLCAQQDFFIFRDFQSRNIMIKNNALYFIDYQGARKGSLQYDLASLLFEAKINLPAQLREELLNYYVEIFNKYTVFNKDKFFEYYYPFVLVRLFQAMGAYGYRGIFEGKSLFLQSIPFAVNILSWLMENKCSFISNFPELKRCLKQIIDLSIINEIGKESLKLTVSVNSFSYRKKIPIDYTGNGGGFVFDCRALPNPYHNLKIREYTGKDKPIIEFFKDKPEADEFLNDVKRMVSRSVKVYQENGFKNLIVNFGCTGGQHRSVFMAEKLADYLKREFDVDVVLKHRELEV